jgi:KaiC/GvpD/RAD55 family RecA-like ATPase
MGRLRVVVSSNEATPLAPVCALVRRAQADGHHVVLVTADRPCNVLAISLGAAGVDMERVHLLDVISMASGRAPAQRPPNVTFLHSPTMLEMIVMRIEQLCHRLDHPHVVLDSLSALALYNGVEPVQEFSHYLASRLRVNAVGADLLVSEHSDGLRTGVQSFLDETITSSQVIP